ncbi:MAG TPA: hypothetical protein VN641_13035 [Urbifossiella sp.]|nr:hypothetical protein [Urbifossiella sp.]
MKRLGSVGLVALCLSVAAGQEPKVPKSGELLPGPFRSYIVVDDRYPPKVAGSTNPDDRDPKDRTNKMHCLVCENGLNPVAAIFIREDAKKLTPTGGVGKLATELNKLLQMPDYRGAKLGAFAIFLKVEGMPKSVVVTNPDKTQTTLDLDAEYPDDEKRDVYAGEIRDLAGGIKAPNVVFGLAPAASTAAKSWGIAETDEVTVVVYNHFRIAKRWTFKAESGPTDDEVKQIIAQVIASVNSERK